MWLICYICFLEYSVFLVSRRSGWMGVDKFLCFWVECKIGDNDIVIVSKKLLCKGKVDVIVCFCDNCSFVFDRLRYDGWWREVEVV